LVATKPQLQLPSVKTSFGLGCIVLAILGNQLKTGCNWSFLATGERVLGGGLVGGHLDVTLIHPNPGLWLVSEFCCEHQMCHFKYYDMDIIV